MDVNAFRRCAPLLATLLFSHAPASAQQQGPAPQAEDEAIVVTGRAEEEARLKEQARAFVRGVEAAPVDGQVGRWNSPICPTIRGVNAQIGAIVATRIRAVARSVGARVATGKCKTNILVSFTGNAKALVDAMRARRGGLLADVPAPEREVLRSAEAPVRWWYTTLTDEADGGSIGSEHPALALQGMDVSTAGRDRTVSRYTSSLIKSSVKVNINTAVILVDVNKAEGHKLDSVADYVAFVALSRIRVGMAPPDAPSILGMFRDGPGGSPTLSRWDSAYLEALYETQADRAASVQRRNIAGRMARKVIE